jgi:hypothetical protein
VSKEFEERERTKNWQIIYKSPDSVSVIERRKLECLGHLIKKDETTLPETFSKVSQIKKKLGKPRHKSIEDAEDDSNFLEDQTAKE